MWYDGPLLFLIYINDLTEGLSSMQSFLQIIGFCFLLYMTFKLLQTILIEILKINFNPDTTKHAQEVVFSRKLKRKVHPPLLLNNVSATWTSSQQHLQITMLV